MRITPDIITELNENEVFVFGSNEAGVHGAGAAKLAMEKFGAKYGQGFGYTGQCFAIPTKDWVISVLSLISIRHYIFRFIDSIEVHPERKYLITQIGCGLAGYTPEDIAPHFKRCAEMENVWLPESFLKQLGYETHTHTV